MKGLLKIAHGIDALNDFIGRWVYWLVLGAVLISAGNAIIRKVFNMSSNAWLELQWYLFSAIFLLAAGYTLLRNEHVRIDIIAGRFSHKAQAWIDVLGTVLFLLPMTLTLTWLSWPYFLQSYLDKEISGSAGGSLADRIRSDTARGIGSRRQPRGWCCECSSFMRSRATCV